MVNVWLGRAMTYDIVSAALVSEIERLHAGGMPGCLFAFYTTPMMSASRALAKLRVYIGSGWFGPATSMTAMMQCLSRLRVKSSVYMGEWCECAFM